MYYLATIVVEISFILIMHVLVQKSPYTTIFF